jgi:hypothetical protein
MEVEMIKQNEKAKVRTIRANSTDTDIALIQQELDTIKNNHISSTIWLEYAHGKSVAT